QIVARPRGEVVPARVRLETTALAAAALAPVRMDEDVAELARDARMSLVQLSAEDDARADAAADEDDDEIVHAPPRAGRALAPGRDREVVPDPERQPGRARLDELEERHLAPAEVR